MYLNLNRQIKQLEMLQQGLNLVLTKENEATKDDKKETSTQATSNEIYALICFTSQ